MANGTQQINLISSNFSAQPLSEKINFEKVEIPITIDMKNYTKPEGKRLYDENGYIKRVYALCIDSKNDKILTITSTRNKNQFIIPGGKIDENESPEQAVLRELFEEAGIIAELKPDSYIDQYFDVNEKRKTRSWVYKCYLVSELDVWEESINPPYRERRWVRDIEEAVEVTSHKEIYRNILGLLKDRY